MAKDWREMMAWCGELLERSTGETVEQWNAKIREADPSSESELRAWLRERDIHGYAQMVLIMERFGYPEFLTATADELFDAQYESRPALRPVAERVIELAQLAGPEVTIQMRKTYVAFVSPRRTFAQLVPSTRTRIDLGLRLDVPPEGRLLPAKNLGNRVCPVKIGLTSLDEVDQEVADLLARSYQENL
ncbi:DUF5655 domain-containing protein [Gulosibacter molinativorax]|uniref:DUF5655 domain-containing protein n=1 Tax=Gulosibacter molinativorax TaxID=256821 RepID=A0ABT7CAP7_9MICO|nr:DUF5655 domain-containing protein [Gulosibacter molinativorax]MDJ1372277.1 hypothetical protein [Gulosibacter molinativorax]QUY63438.1 Hypotetical protein [Gulosibacter molinativorax]